MVKVQDVDGLMVRELKAELKRLGVRGYSRLRKAELQKELKKELRKRARKSPKKKTARRSPPRKKTARKSPKKKAVRKSPPKKKAARRSPSPAENYARARRAVGKSPQRRPPMRRVSPSRLRSSMSPGVAKEASLTKTYASLPKTRQYKRRQVAALKPGEGRGSPTRGWSGRAPQRGRERHDLMDQCGKKYFLEPKSEGYPVCAALRTGQGCNYDCGGIQSAYNRARQYKNRTVATRAQRLLNKEKCYLRR